jgi:hypothetical protein
LKLQLFLNQPKGLKRTDGFSALMDKYEWKNRKEIKVNKCQIRRRKIEAEGET